MSKTRCGVGGGGRDGRLGNGSTGDKNYPVPIIAGSGSSSFLRGIVEIASFSSASCALSEEGRVLCWGWGNYGQLGYGGTDNQSSPVTVIPASGVRSFSISEPIGKATPVWTAALVPLIP